MIPMVLKKERVDKDGACSKNGMRCCRDKVFVRPRKWRKNINWILFVEIQTKTVTNQTTENKNYNFVC